MSAQHTPGPWSWGDDFCGLYGSGKDNEVLTHAYYENMWLSYGPQREANARLIAAAPELLEALQMGYAETMDCIRLNKLGGEDNQWLRLARAAIAKATGDAA